jgi:protoporphyrin/coproporphyrin ferrochelatase
VIPLYPQYCAATTATVGDEVFRVLERMRFQPALRIAPPYYDDDAYIEALASTTDAAIAGLDLKPDVILASFHGVPQAYVDKGDPYYTQCLATMRLLRARLGLDEKKLLLTFQSRFGRAQWLEPATDQTVRKLAKEGVKIAWRRWRRSRSRTRTSSRSTADRISPPSPASTTARRGWR